MSEPIRHDLKSIADILNVITPDNVETFIKDFEQFLMLYLFVKGSSNMTMDDADTFSWCDDNKPGLSEARITAGEKTIVIRMSEGLANE